MSDDKKTYEDFMKYDADEGMSKFLRRARHEETISSDIALHLAEMVFVRVVGKRYTEERMPLVSLTDCYVVQLSQVFMLRVFPVGTNY
jgi:hypothetical protein